MKIASSEKINKVFRKGEIFYLNKAQKSFDFIETQVSFIYFVGEKAYKFYKSENNSFNKNFFDLSNEKTREIFYREDFYWNNYFSPSVYLKLLGIKRRKDDGIILVDDLVGVDDFIILMNKVEKENNLTEDLMNKGIGVCDAENIGYEMTKKISRFPKKINKDIDYYSLLQGRIRDIELFSSLADQMIDMRDINKMTSYLKLDLKNKERLIKSFKQEDLSVAIDNHSDNIFYNKGKLSYIDVYLIKKEWQTMEPFANVVRLGADFFAWGGEKLYESIKKGFTKYYGNLKNEQKQLELNYLLQFLLLKTIYNYDLSKKNIKKKRQAEIYWNCSQKVYNNLKS